MSDEKPKSAAVRTEEYEAQEYLEIITPLSSKLQEQYPGSKFDPKSTALLVSQIQQFNEDALGVKSMQPRPFPKLPAKLFQDVRPEGPLHTILSRFHSAMAGRSLKRVDFTNPHHRAKFLDILALVMHELLKQGALRWPKVYIHPSCAAETGGLQALTTRMKGEVVAAPDVPGVTHHVLPFGPKGDPDDGIQYMRNLGKRGDKAMVHWWYYPDSYDELVSLDSAPEVIEPDKQATGPWKVYVRWIKDSVKYNEWMNPIDYEVDDAAPPKDSLAGPGQPNATGTATAGLKRKREESSQPSANGTAALRPPQTLAGIRTPIMLEAGKLPEVTAGAEIAPGLIRQQVLQPDPRALQSASPGVNLSQGQGMGQRTPSRPARDGALPAYASWFRYDSIHANEMQSCPLFFSASPSDKATQYKELRNSLIDEQRRHPTQGLTLTEAAKLHGSDPEGVLQVWRCLDRWGIINFQAIDSPAELDTSSQLQASAPQGETRNTTAASLEEAEALFRTRPLPTPQRGAAAAAGKSRSMGLVTGLPQPGAQSAVKEARFFCNAMPEVECTQVHYHCTKLPDVNLCPQAFADGRFPAGCGAKDFVRIDQSHTHAVDGIWSDQDTLLLLEGLELFGDNWAEISDHVGTKSQIQCITHFLRLPVEDEYLDQLESPGGKQPGSAGSEEGETAAEIPFADQDNPVMAQIAFLAAMVGPQVAAAAAQRALEVLLEDGPHSPPDTAVDGMLATVEDRPPRQATVCLAASNALAAAAVKAKLLAEEEEKETQQLAKQAVGIQMQLLDRRMLQFSQLQQAMEEERLKAASIRDAATKERVKLQEAKQQIMMSGQAHPTTQPMLSSGGQPRAPLPIAGLPMLTGGFPAHPVQNIAPHPQQPPPASTSASLKH